MNNYFENANTLQEKREVLKQLSKPLQQLVKEEALDSVNDGLKALYSEDGHKELKTLRQWNKDGKRVIKGQKALCLWGKPKENNQDESEDGRRENDDNDTTENDNMSFFPVCYVFSNLQVQ